MDGPRERSRSPPPKQRPPPESFLDRKFITEHMEEILEFYNKAGAKDHNGGFYQSFYDDGTRFNEDVKQLVSSTRFVFNYAMAGMLLKRPALLALARHGLNYIEKVHWMADKKGYAFTLQNHVPNDTNQSAYGYSFVLLAFAACRKAGVITDNTLLDKVWDLLEERFFLPDFGLYADKMDSNGKLVPYRGYGTNLHVCDALNASYEATGDIRFLERALLVVENVTRIRAAMTKGWIWDHCTPDWEPDFEHNRNDPKNLYEPYGFLPGHWVEWVTMLVRLHRHRPQPWMLTRACELFDKGFETVWDHEYGGMAYTFDHDDKWLDDDKYFWVQCEAFEAAALLLQHTGDAKYRKAYDMLWQYSWEHFVDHEHGAWWRVLRRNNSKYSKEKSTPGAKCDYHTLGACFEILRTLDEADKMKEE